jgi:hypothetical protein
LKSKKRSKLKLRAKNLEGKGKRKKHSLGGAAQEIVQNMIQNPSNLLLGFCENSVKIVKKLNQHVGSNC